MGRMVIAFTASANSGRACRKRVRCSSAKPSARSVATEQTNQSWPTPSLARGTALFGASSPNGKVLPSQSVMPSSRSSANTGSSPAKGGCRRSRRRSLTRCWNMSANGLVWKTGSSMSACWYSNCVAGPVVWSQIRMRVRTRGCSVAAGSAEGAQPLPPGFADQKPLIEFWGKELNQVVAVDLTKDAPELADPAAQERHRIYSYLLMKLIHRFWNGNKRGPLGTYPLRARQQDLAQLPPNPKRYRGDMIANPGGLRVNWDRYLGHNIACIAVDGNGEIIDLDFNHNDLFRSSAEHAESRI